MSRRTNAIAAAMSVLALGSPLISACANPSVKVNNSFKSGVDKHEQGDYQGAIADYNKAIEISLKFDVAYSNQRNAKNQLKDYQSAIDNYDKSIAIDPKNTNAYVNRGRAKNVLKDHQGAASDYNKSIKLNPQIGLSYSNRAIAIYDLTGDVESACKDIKKAASLGMEYRVNYLNSEEGQWCRDM